MLLVLHILLGAAEFLSEFEPIDAIESRRTRRRRSRRRRSERRLLPQDSQFGMDDCLVFRSNPIEVCPKLALDLDVFARQRSLEIGVLRREHVAIALFKQVHALLK